MDLIDLYDNSEKLMDDFIRSRLHVENDEVDKDFLDFDHDKLDLIEDEQILPNSCKEKCSQPEEFIANVDVIAIDKEQVAELVLEEMECPICLIEMTPPKKIYACSNAHLFCQNCKVPALKTCPKCREDFVKQPPLRSTLAERWACKLFQL